MLQVVELHIVEFRGIRDLTLDLGGESFVVSGPNGSGKSGVVDALNFVLTGNIARLQGPGTGSVTMARHGPHVLRRDDPGAAFVSATVLATRSGESARITRSVKAPGTYELDPDLPSVRSAIDEAALHAEMVLSRREIMKFVIAEPGRRAAEIQALLKLDRLSLLRSRLRTLNTQAANGTKRADTSASIAQQALERHLDVASLTASQIRPVINQRRRLLGLDEFEAVSRETDFAIGLTEGATEGAFNKPSAVADLAALNRVLENLVAATRSVTALEEAMAPVDADPSILPSLRTRELVESGIDHLVDEHCPLCDHPWADAASLRAHLEAKLQRSRQAAEIQRVIEVRASAVASFLQTLAGLVAPVSTIGPRLGRGELAADLEEWRQELVAGSASLASVAGVQDLRTKLLADPTLRSRAAAKALEELGAAVTAVPDQSEKAAAQSFLTIAQERWIVLRTARGEQATAKRAAATAASLYNHYCDAQDEGLARLYGQVEHRLGELYLELNDDEAGFRAALEPSAQALDLLVEFYGQGLYPPLAYHSEGHQDGMGLCLYLALMEHLLADDFKLAVLDDVVMSVDVSHRKQLCGLLQRQFPQVQFIITTHDDVWARQMLATLVQRNRHARFVNWTLNDGPIVAEGSDVWDQIAKDLVHDDVSPAAARLRRHLESTLADVADRMSAQVPYRSLGTWDLGDFMNGVKGRYSKLLGAAAKSANSWNDDNAKAAVLAAKTRWQEASLVQTSEQWAVNPAVHYNEWANFSRQDFMPVVEACRAFLAIFECSNCDSPLHVSRVGNVDEALRCPCGATNLALLTKP